MMRINHILKILLFALMPVFCTFISAYAGTVFGPEKYTRTDRKPSIFKDKFDAAEGEARLRIFNGRSNASGRITSAYVYVNDKVVAKPDDFKNRVYRIVKDISLRPVNTIRVEIEGRSETFLTLEVEQESLYVSINCMPDRIKAGERAALSWMSSHADRVYIDNEIGDVNPIGSYVVSPKETTMYTITATGSNRSITDRVTLHVEPASPAISLSPAETEIVAGESVLLSWTSRHVDECILSPGIGNVEPNGSRIISPEGTTTYKLTGKGPGGAADATATVTVIPPGPEIVFWASDLEIDHGKEVILNWKSSNTETCKIPPDIGKVELNGSTNVRPEKTTTYTMSAKSPGGTVEKRITITVRNKSPEITFTADPDTITDGDSSNLSWTVGHASSVSIDSGIGSVKPKGAHIASPDQTTTYTLTAEGPGGSASRKVTVSVLPKRGPDISVKADPAVISAGREAEITWTTEGAEEVTIEPGIGAVDPSGSLKVAPDETTTYVIKATGTEGKTVEKNLTIEVSAAEKPSAKLLGSPRDILYGEGAQLSWHCSNTDSCIIAPEIGSVALNGTRIVFPEKTTIYTLTAKGAGGTATDSIEISVRQSTDRE